MCGQIIDLFLYFNMEHNQIFEMTTQVFKMWFIILISPIKDFQELKYILFLNLLFLSAFQF